MGLERKLMYNKSSVNGFEYSQENSHPSSVLSVTDVGILYIMLSISHVFGALDLVYHLSDVNVKKHIMCNLTTLI